MMSHYHYLEIENQTWILLKTHSHMFQLLNNINPLTDLNDNNNEISVLVIFLPNLEWSKMRKRKSNLKEKLHHMLPKVSKSFKDHIKTQNPNGIVASG